MINLAAVRASGSVPRVHGNGFIQLDLTERSRLHVWGDKRIPRQKVSTPIHDHVFGFLSTIIVGRMVNTIYRSENHPAGLYFAYTAVAREDADTGLEISSPYSYRLTAESALLYKAGTPYNTYMMAPFVFHESVPLEPSATVIVKDGPTLTQGADCAPTVMVRRGFKPDNDFNRYGHDVDMLWRIIEETLKGRTR